MSLLSIYILGNGVENLNDEMKKRRNKKNKIISHKIHTPEIIKCPFCGHENNFNNDFCEVCDSILHD